MKKTEYMQYLADQSGCHIDTLYKHRRGDVNMRKKLAKKLAEITGLSWLMFYLPEEHGNPWDQLIK